MTYATDGTSRLLVIADADPEAGPVVSIHLPVRVPLGLHGSRLPAPDRGLVRGGAIEAERNRLPGDRR